MASLLPDFEYDVFISYRQKDNEYDGWVTEFVENLKNELQATFKEEVSIYFDQNPDDGLQSTHQVAESLDHKLKCAVFIPIVSQTYCDPNCYAWGAEFIPFVKHASEDSYGLNVQAKHGNVYSRVLPIKIHELDSKDQALFEQVTGGIMRSVDFIYKSDGVNRPLRPKADDTGNNTYQTVYRDQINKVANALKSIIEGMAPKQMASSQDSSSHINIQKELVERSLYKVALVYVLVGLLSWKVAEVAVSYFDLPEGLIKGVIITLIILFPLAITMAWFFERTPKGFALVGSELSKDNPLSPQKRKPLTSNYWILVLLVLSLTGYLIPQQYLGIDSKINTIENKSIAVLYFDNMSGDPEQEYFSDGITEEIIARLTKIEGLRVISRTSTQVYKGQPRNLKKIAKELNVSVVLEGSFRKSGNQIKVVAQLIDAQTDVHIWAETFDRELKDIFQVQSDIAHEIAKKFEIEVAAETELKIEKQITSNTEAYDYYLRARHIAFNEYYYNWDSIDFERSKTMYEKSILLDDNFAEAYAGLADLYDANRLSNKSAFSKEKDSIRHALSWKSYLLDSNSAFVNNVRIWMFLNRDEPLEDSAFYHAKKALELDPNDHYNYQSLGYMMLWHGLYDLAIPFYEKAVNLSPLSADYHASLAFFYWMTHDLEKAEKFFQSAYELEQNKGYSTAWGTIVWFILQEQQDKANLLINNMDFQRPRFDAFQSAVEGDGTEALNIATKELNGFWLEVFFAMTPIKGKSLEFLSSDLENKYNHYLILKNLDTWEPYFSDPKYQETLKAYKIKHEENKRKYGVTLSDFTLK